MSRLLSLVSLTTVLVMVLVQFEGSAGDYERVCTRDQFLGSRAHSTRACARRLLWIVEVICNDEDESITTTLSSDNHHQISQQKKEEGIPPASPPPVALARGNCVYQSPTI